MVDRREQKYKKKAEKTGLRIRDKSCEAEKSAWREDDECKYTPDADSFMLLCPRQW